MPQQRQGDMWSVYQAADLFLITTNATLKQNGALVMGRGIAQQARDRFPGLDLALGRHIDMVDGGSEDARRRGLSEYGLLVSPRWPAAKLGAFQVKSHYHQPADLALITHSTEALAVWCEGHPQAAVHLNYPGVGNGGLHPDDVWPIVARLPETVTLWTYGQQT
jgi:hypothetical protein